MQSRGSSGDGDLTLPCKVIRPQSDARRQGRRSVLTHVFQLADADNSYWCFHSSKSEPGMHCIIAVNKEQRGTYLACVQHRSCSFKVPIFLNILFTLHIGNLYKRVTYCCARGRGGRLQETGAEVCCKIIQVNIIFIGKGNQHIKKIDVKEDLKGLVHAE